MQFDSLKATCSGIAGKKVKFQKVLSGSNRAYLIHFFRYYHYQHTLTLNTGLHEKLKLDVYHFLRQSRQLLSPDGFPCYW